MGGSDRALGGRYAFSVDDWYYREPSGTEEDDDPVVGPVPLDRVVELLRAGALVEDVPVSVDAVNCRSADEVEQVLEALPFDRERLIREFIEYGEAAVGEERWGWASDRMYAILEGAPELAWTLIKELIARAPSEQSLRFFAAGPLEDLLSKDGELFIERVEQLAELDPKFLHAVATLRRLGMTDDVWHRVQVLAERDPPASAMPRVSAD